MKKTFAIIISVMLIACTILSLTACASPGKYMLTEAKIAGATVNIEDAQKLISGVGLDGECYIELKFGGTGEMHILGKTTEIKWNGSELWPVDDEDAKMSFEIDGDELILDMDGIPLLTDLIFVKD